MKKQLLLSTFLTAALAVGTAHAAGMDKSTDASSSQSGSMQSGQMESSSQATSGQEGYDSSRVGVQGAAADQSAQITNNPDAVRQIQQALKDKGADLQVDGVWGPSTEQALMDFQKDQGQGQATGQPDQETLQALDVDIAAGQPQTAQTPSDTAAPGATTPSESWTSGGQGPASGSGNMGSDSMGAGGSGMTPGQESGTGGGSGSGSTTGSGSGQ